MTAGALVLLLLLPSALVWTPFAQDVSGSDTWVKVNASASDFERFRERFGRNYEVNSPQFDRRLSFFQVGSGSCSASSCNPALFDVWPTHIEPNNVRIPPKFNLGRMDAPLNYYVLRSRPAKHLRGPHYHNTATPHPVTISTLIPAIYYSQ